jgi:hypothetical protein
MKKLVLTIPSNIYKETSVMEEKEWKTFRNSDKSDRTKFDQMFSIAIV